MTLSVNGHMFLIQYHVLYKEPREPANVIYPFGFKVSSGDIISRILGTGTGKAVHRNNEVQVPSLQTIVQDEDNHIAEVAGQNLDPTNTSMVQSDSTNSKLSTSDMGHLTANKATDSSESKNVNILPGHIFKLAGYADDKMHTYSINKLPSKGLQWGTRTKFHNKSHILCEGNGNNPSTIWIAGQISGLWFFDKNGTPSEHVAITVVPFSVDATGIARKMLSLKSTPTLEIAESDWSAVQPFTEVFDACDTFTSKHKMTTYPISDLNLKDIVLIEAWVTHYRKKDRTSSMGSPDAYKWVNWVASFELQSVSLLHRPDSTEGEGNSIDTVIEI
ncbi:hypothetical protein SERLA73DRAFT_156309 [Serpula lacrymans var. lacrymans S7.3]|uniref:Uncharacterized protein n=2 Tax=Serpula lacrymans var. lacrymans TaxID=341189 RepID=F8QDW1_SERL3|nr:uncharacterized protein SERLADRAFT_412006 [Serpula lacrymans var. lacrymans S7.9]EGN93336.1 hypothetical protein SERLA73DRAFT_156309 [Serpula lacrymans var. lacrymans S7.3]EGO18723.1 hypothetical protein SERLADRAFT_412006 [Serpula lacrymans var. lacrymans S7.9]